MAATTAKTAMQIPTVSQKTKSIRSPSFELLSGSQGRKMATAVAIAAATSAIVIKRTIAPLRTGAEPTQRLRYMPLLLTAATPAQAHQRKRMKGPRSNADSD